MPLDASIYARFAPKSVSDYDLEAANVQGAQQTNALNALRLQAGNRAEADAQRSLQEQTGVRNALTALGGGATDDQRINALRGLGTQTGFAQADALEKSSLERQKVGADVKGKLSEAEKRSFDMAHERLGAFNNLLAGVTDQASYQAAIAQGKQLGVDPASVPPQYDPAYIASAQQRSITEQQRLENAAKQRGYDLTASAQAETGRHNVAAEKNAAGQLGVAQANLGLSRQRLANEQAAPKGQVVQTDQGMMLVDPRAGTAQPITGPTGEALSKPLQNIPASANEKIVENAQNLRRAQQALALVQGKDVGEAKGDTSATGLKGYLPTGMLNRIDPTGTDTRAAVADLGSLVIHDRSGAAVTASESPRLMPFIPLATDDKVTVEKKLKRFVSVYEDMTKSYAETYSKEQGYKANPATKPTQTASAGVPDDIAALLKKHGGK